MKKSTNISWVNKPSTAEKQQFLSSQLISHDAIGVYEKIKARPKEGEVIDLDIKGIPADFDEGQLKRVLNMKHVISVETK